MKAFKQDIWKIKYLHDCYKLIPDTNYKHLECFVMLGTHFESHRDQMSHICDISVLKVKRSCGILGIYFR